MGTPFGLSDVERVKIKTLVGIGDQCWVWTGGWSGGEPVCSRRIGPSRYTSASPVRLLWEETHGPLSPRTRLRRTCPHRSCVNPAHFRAAEPRQRKRIGPPLTPEERFWSRVEKTDGCWWWLPTKEKNQYGHIRVQGSPWLAHRYSYYLANGRIPRALLACHHCDNPSCVRPDHLFMGTILDNTRDMIAKGRQGRRGPNKKTLARIAA